MEWMEWCYFAGVEEVKRDALRTFRWKLTGDFLRQIR